MCYLGAATSLGLLKTSCNVEEESGDHYLAFFGYAVISQFLDVFVVWLQVKCFREVGDRTCVLSAAVSHHPPSHPSFLELRVEIDGPTTCE